MCDETWSRKTAPLTLMHNWRDQLELAEQYAQKHPYEMGAPKRAELAEPVGWRDIVDDYIARGDGWQWLVGLGWRDIVNVDRKLAETIATTTNPKQ